MDAALRFFFCIGCQKTGTSLLARLLDCQAGMACMWESYSLSPLHEFSILDPYSHNCIMHEFDPKLITSLRAVWELDKYDYFMARDHRKQAFQKTMPVLMEDFARRKSATIIGDKWPWYIRYLDILRDVFPTAKFIYTVRDPRGLWNSAQRFLLRERGNVILWEMLFLDRLLEQHNIPDSDIITIRYEDLVRSTTDNVSLACHFLGQQISPDQVDLYSNTGEDRWWWVPETKGPIEPRHVDKWKYQMHDDEIKWVEAESAAFMNKYGYLPHSF